MSKDDKNDRMAVPPIDDTSGTSPSTRAAFFFPLNQPAYKDHYKPLKLQDTWNNIMKNLNPISRNGIEWGNYQKYAAPQADWNESDAADAAILFSTWDSYQDEARDGLRRLQWSPPGGVGNPKFAANPFRPTMVMDNLTEHLDEAVRVALWDLPKNDNGVPFQQLVPIDISVSRRTKNNRHHGMSVWWDLVENGPSITKVKALHIEMTCPLGGWDGYAQWPPHRPDFAQRLTRFEANWVVPAPPQNPVSGEVVFLFIGFEGSAKRAVMPPAIIQPVLMWHNGKWRIRSWYVPANINPAEVTLPAPTAQQMQTASGTSALFYTDAPVVQVGDILKGVIEETAQGAGKFSYRSYFMKNGAAQALVQLDVREVGQMAYAVAAVEAYGVSKKAHLPDSFVMSPAVVWVNGAVTPVPWKATKPARRFFEVVANPGQNRIEFTKR